MKTVRSIHAAFAVGCATLAVLTGDVGDTRLIIPAAHAEEAPTEALAARLRIQGHACEKTLSAERDVQRSRPDSAVWIVKCTNAAYRVQLVPNQAAKIERIDDQPQEGRR